MYRFLEDCDEFSLQIDIIMRGESFITPFKTKKELGGGHLQKTINHTARERSRKLTPTLLESTD